MKLIHIQGEFSIVRLNPSDEIPDWLWSGPFCSVSKTNDEISVVCETKLVPSSVVDFESGWNLIKVEGPLDFSLTGILSSIASPLAERKISIFAVSTYETDYFMVKKPKVDETMRVLEEKGFEV